MSEIVIDASLALQWFLEDETDRGYSVAVLRYLSQVRAVVPVLWFYEMGNGLTMAVRRKRITVSQTQEYLDRVPQLPISVDRSDPETILGLPQMAASYQLTNYDAAYLDLAMRRRLPLATTDNALRRAAAKAGVDLVNVP